jgi:acyl-CoA-binding protein
MRQRVLGGGTEMEGKIKRDNWRGSEGKKEEKRERKNINILVALSAQS